MYTYSNLKFEALTEGFTFSMIIVDNNPKLMR